MTKNSRRITFLNLLVVSLITTVFIIGIASIKNNLSKIKKQTIITKNQTLIKGYDEMCDYLTSNIWVNKQESRDWRFPGTTYEWKFQRDGTYTYEISSDHASIEYGMWLINASNNSYTLYIFSEPRGYPGFAAIRHYRIVPRNDGLELGSLLSQSKTVFTKGDNQTKIGVSCGLVDNTRQLYLDHYSRLNKHWVNDDYTLSLNGKPVLTSDYKNLIVDGGWVIKPSTATEGVLTISGRLEYDWPNNVGLNQRDKRDGTLIYNYKLIDDGLSLSLLSVLYMNPNDYSVIEKLKETMIFTEAN